MMALLIFAYIIIILMDLRDILQAKKKLPVLIIYIFLIISGFTISLLLNMDKLPVSPSKLIEKVLDTILGR
ncbi:MAG: hypothetical protein ACOCRZ_06665 [Halothermotrichaceae bacterium]